MQDSNQPDMGRKGLHYAWVVAGVVFLVMLATAGVRSTPSVLIVPLEKEFGWDRATISFAVSVNLVLYGLIGPFAAAIMAGLGLRRTVITSMIILGVGVVSTTMMREAWHLILLWGVVVGGGTGMTAMVLGATVVDRWFVKRRGLVVGILAASTATGQMVFLPLLATLVRDHSWRTAVLIVAGAIACIIPLVVLFLRDRPADLGLRAYGADEEEAAAPVAPVRVAVNPFTAAITGLRDGLRSRDFWLLAGSFFVCGASTNGLIGTHLIPACADHGISEVHAAGLLAMMGVFDIIGTTVAGWLSDRWDNRKLLAWFYGLRGLALVYLPFAFGGSWGLMAFALFYGLDWIATVPPTVRLTTNAFGRERTGIMFGWILAAHQLGAGFAAFGAGSVRSWMGDYEKAFLTSGAMCLLTAAMVLQIGRVRAGKGRGQDGSAVPVGEGGAP